MNNRRLGLSSAALLAGALLLPGAVAAQGDGYLFKQPRVSFAILGGWQSPRGSSDIFDFTSEHLTVDRSDFATGNVAFQIGFAVLPRLDLVFEGGYAESTIDSEFRDFVEETDNGDLPIQQVTRLKQTPLTVSARFYLLERGRSIGQYAFIANRWAPYIGAGVGRVSYVFQQEGDFVDIDTLDIFTDFLESKNSGLIKQAFAGADVTLAPNFNLLVEGRYTSASSAMRGDFGGFADSERFDDIDLSGFQVSVGLGVRF